MRRERQYQIISFVCFLATTEFGIAVIHQLRNPPFDSFRFYGCACFVTLFAVLAVLCGWVARQLCAARRQSIDLPLDAVERRWRIAGWLCLAAGGVAFVRCGDCFVAANADGKTLEIGADTKLRFWASFSLIASGVLAVAGFCCIYLAELRDRTVAAAKSTSKQSPS